MVSRPAPAHHSFSVLLTMLSSLTQSMAWVSAVLRPLVRRGTISILLLVSLGLWLGTSGVAQAQTGTTLTVNGVTTPLTVPSGATVTLAVSGGSGGVMDCLAVYPAGLPDLANGSYIDYRFLNGLKTAPVTGLTSASVSFPMPTPAGTYEFRWWKDCATLAVKSQVVTVGGGALSFTVNGVTSPLTVASGATVTLAVSGGSGGVMDCLAVYPAGLPDLANGSYIDYRFLNGLKTAPVTGLTSASVSFPMPTPAGTYEFRWWKDCATLAVKSQVVTVGGGALSFTVNGVTTPLTVAAGATVNVGVQNGPGNPLDCVALYPAGLPDVADGSYLNVFFLNGTKTAPTTGLTSATVVFPMPATLGPYEFRLWRNCATILAKSQVVTVSTGAVSFTVNGVTSPLTVGAGATVTVGVQNGPGNPLDCVALYPAGLPDVADGSYLNVFFLNGTKTAPTTGLTSATVVFPMPATLGPYEFRLWRNCATILAKSQVVTVQSGGTTGDSSYVYDRLGRLIAVITGSEMAIYQYDAVGNLLSIMRQSSAAVSILDFSPRSGSPGTTVTIYGTGFSTTRTQNTVTFNGVPATVVSATTTQLVVQVPSGGTLGPIAVSSPNGSATSTKLFGVSP